MLELPFIAIIIAGLIGSVGQMMIVRELLVIFYGNELTAGIILTVWTIWIAIGSATGGRFGRRFTKEILKSALIFLGLLLPVTILWIRSARVIWNVPIGEILSLGKMLSISLSVMGPFCFFSGFIFSLSWSLQVANGYGKHPVIIYLGEAVGAAIGGVIVYLVFLPFIPSFQASLIVSLAILIILAITVRPWQNFKCLSLSTMLWGSAGTIVVLGLCFSEQLDNLSHRLQIGHMVVAVRDSPYQHLTLTKQNDQWTLFANSIWQFSIPDPQTSETLVHPILLQHPNPKKILMIGSVGPDPVKEVLKYQEANIDIVESDPYLLPFITKYLPQQTSVFSNQRVRVIHQDARVFVQTTEKTYDVILMNVGDPINAQMNRFYTDSFFYLIQQRLAPKGIFAFSVSASPNILGSSQIQYVQSIYETLRMVFNDILVYPGDNIRFLVSSTRGILNKNPEDLIQRKNEKGLDISYVHDFYFFDILNPLQVRYITKVLRDPSSTPKKINQDFTPICYYYNLILWGTQIHPYLQKILSRLGSIHQYWFWSWIGGFALIALLIWVLIQPRIQIGIGICTGVTGGALIVGQIVLIIGFQILAGYIYQQLCLIIAVFMAGLAIGSGISKVLFGHNTKKLLFIIQNILACHLILSIGTIHVLHSVKTFISISWIFSILALFTGMMGGCHFSLSVKAFSNQPIPGPSTGGGLYAIDLLGCAIAAILSTLIVIPIYGLTPAMISVALLTFASSIVLIL